MKKTNEREIALDILTEILNDGAYGNISLRGALNGHKSLASHQKAFITEIVNGSLRNLILIDYYIDSFSNTKTRKMKPFILNVLRISVYQLIFMDKTPPSAICNEAVNLTKARGFHNLAGFVNGVLRSIERKKALLSYPDREQEPDLYLSVRYSFPLWLIRYWIEAYGMEDTEKICVYSSQPPKVNLCVNLLKTSPAELKEQLLSLHVAVSDEAAGDALSIAHTGDIAALPAYRKGHFHIMDESAMLAVKALDPQPGQTVMDVCAAPGGKSFYAAYLMRNTGKILAWDIHAHKIGLVNEAAARLGIAILSCELSDARLPRPQLYGTADRVLVDAPCSGLGIARKKPDLKYSKDIADIQALTVLQKELLAACSRYVKPGGVLVYSTCTITPAENDDIVQWFLDHFPFVPDEDIDRFLPGYMAIRGGTPRLIRGGTPRLIRGGTPQPAAGTIQLLPGENNDGFFIARFIRKD